MFQSIVSDAEAIQPPSNRGKAMTIIELNVAGYHGTLRVDFTPQWRMKRGLTRGWRRVPADDAECLLCELEPTA